MPKIDYDKMLVDFLKELMKEYLLFLIGWIILGFGIWLAIKVSTTRYGDYGVYPTLIFTGAVAMSAINFWGAFKRLSAGLLARKVALCMAWLTTVIAALAVTGILAIAVLIGMRSNWHAL